MNDSAGKDERGEDLVEIVHRVNRLKKKVAPAGEPPSEGHIDPEAIKKAQEVIAASEQNYRKALDEILSKLEILWSELKDKKRIDNEEFRTEFYKLCNRIQDMANTYGYSLMGSFSESLKIFSKDMNTGKPAHITITEAHIGVMKITFSRKIRLEDSPEAEELRKSLQTAIQRHTS